MEQRWVITSMHDHDGDDDYDYDDIGRLHDKGTNGATVGGYNA